MKPIIFNGPMVRAILDGQKTQTRRVITRLYRLVEAGGMILGGHVVGEAGNAENPLGFMTACGIEWPKHNVSDILWIRETWDCAPADISSPVWNIAYAADGMVRRVDMSYKFNPILYSPARWRPSIHMPREAARLFLRVKDVRVERVQDMCVADCVNEGVTWDNYPNAWTVNAKPAFVKLWDTINAKRGYGWDTNPWVWVYEFEQVSKADAEDIERSRGYDSEGRT